MLPAIKTDIVTQDGLCVYDLDPAAPELLTVAGPDGYDPATLDFDHLPEEFRVVDVDEWGRLTNQT